MIHTFEFHQHHHIDDSTADEDVAAVASRVLESASHANQFAVAAESDKPNVDFLPLQHHSQQLHHEYQHEYQHKQLFAKRI